MAAVTGALALSAFAVPAAHADAPVGPDLDKPTAAERFGTSPAETERSSRIAAQAAPVVSDVTVNGGRNLVFGTTTVRTFTVSLTASHPSGILDAYIDLWHGTDVDAGLDGLMQPNEDAADCTPVDATTSTCTLTVTAQPGFELYKNALSGTWHVSAAALSNDGTMYWNDFHKTHKLLRMAKLTADATPEPVKKGGTLTIDGKLTRANWQSFKYDGYADQSVKVQFRADGAADFPNLKGIYSKADGTARTTVTATTSGDYRFSFTGAANTAAVSSTVDHVAVQ